MLGAWEASMSVLDERKVRARLDQLSRSMGSSRAVSCQFMLQPDDRAWNPCRFSDEIGGRCQLTYTRYPDGLISATALYWQDAH
jgi:hypothetical protein